MSVINEMLRTADKSSSAQMGDAPEDVIGRGPSIRLWLTFGLTAIVLLLLAKYWFARPVNDAADSYLAQNNRPSESEHFAGVNEIYTHEDHSSSNANDSELTTKNTINEPVFEKENIQRPTQNTDDSDRRQSWNAHTEVALREITPKTQTITQDAPHSTSTKLAPHSHSASDSSATKLVATKLVASKLLASDEAALDQISSDSPLPLNQVSVKALPAPEKISIQKHAVDALEQSRRLRAEAARMSSAGDYLRAAALLEKASQLNPNDLELNLDWLTVLSAVRPIDAAPLIDQRLAEDPLHWKLRELKANLLIREGRFNEVFKLLSTHPAPITEYPNYYAALALASQQLGLHQAALEYYQELVRLQPFHGQFNAGAGMAADHLNHSYLAQKHYQTALQDPALASSVQQFIVQRLNALKQAQP